MRGRGALQPYHYRLLYAPLSSADAGILSSSNGQTCFGEYLPTGMILFGTQDAHPTELHSFLTLPINFCNIGIVYKGVMPFKKDVGFNVIDSLQWTQKRDVCFANDKKNMCICGRSSSTVRVWLLILLVVS